MAKNIYIGVGNVARKVKQPNIGVDNVARKVKSGFIGVNNVARQFFSGGIPISTFSVGDTVYLNENGVKQAYLIVNQGIPSGSSLYSSSCNGTWLLRKDLIESRVWGDNSSLNRYASSPINNWLNTDMFAKYDADVQSSIKQVKIPYSPGMYAGPKTGEDGLECKIFLLSGYEVGYSTAVNSMFPVDGAILSYFISGISTEAISKRNASLNGSYSHWWLRSPQLSNESQVCFVPKNGSWGRSPYWYSYGIRPALILPFETLIDVT